MGHQEERRKDGQKAAKRNLIKNLIKKSNESGRCGHMEEGWQEERLNVGQQADLFVASKQEAEPCVPRGFRR